MPPRMRTQTAGRPSAESLGGGMGEQVSNQGNVGNQNGNVVNENVQENVGNVLVNGNRLSSSYKEFLACNPKEYDGKGGVVVLTRWIKKMESVHDMSGCSIDQKVKYTVRLFVGKALTWWNSQIHTLIWEVAVSMSWNDFKFMMIQEFCPSHEMQKLESKLWNHAMVEAGYAAYTDRFHELARLVPHLVNLESRMIERYVYGLAPQIRRMVAATELKTIQKAVQISGALTDEAVRNGSIKKVKKRGNMGETSKDKNGRDDNKRTRTGNVFATTVNPVGRENMGVPRNVNPVNARNLTLRACYECGCTDHGQGRGNQGNQARGRAFMLGAEEACQDPNIVTGLEPSELGFKYEIEIASSLQIDIRLLSYSIVVTLGIVIVCHEKVVEIPLEGSRKLRFQGERTLGAAKALMNAKVDEPKVGDISVVRDFVDTRVSYDLVIFREEHQCRLLRREAWSSFEVSVGITEEGEVVTYLRFIANFSKIVKPITSLTERNQKYEWGAERKEAFQTLKNDFCDASIN
ncbi:reverse transcriptase domain-containing protein [Tanacetum coccineum]